MYKNHIGLVDVTGNGFAALAEGFDVAVPRTSPTNRSWGFEPRFARSRVLGSWRLERVGLAEGLRIGMWVVPPSSLIVPWHSL